MALVDSVREPSKRGAILVLFGVGLLVTVVQLGRIRDNPDFAYLDDRGGAHWIYREHANLAQAITAEPLTIIYAASFSVARPPDECILEVQALRTFQVRLDGDFIRDYETDDPETWKDVTTIDLAPFLTPGNHRLDVVVTNDRGPAAVWARCPELGLYSGEDWVVYLGNGRTVEVTLAREADTVPVSYQFGPVWVHLLRALPWLVPVFVLALVAVLKFPARIDARITNRTARVVAGVTVAAVVLLGLNNMFRLDFRLGYDAQGHYEYIDWVADKWTLPLATDGWQMFQSPLYYVISAPVFGLTTAENDLIDFNAAAEQDETSHFYPVRIVSIVLGALHPLVAYLFAALAWPDRPKLQIFATLFGGLLPVNIYMSQFVGNETLMGILGAAVLLLAAYVLKGDGPPSMRLSIGCGIALGLALLAKASALLLIPVCFAAFASRFWGLPGALPDFLKKLAVVAALCFIISGWYYIRNWIRLGEPFVGGWEAREGMGWWQAPGYRMAADYLRFGMALTYPVYAGFAGVWDGLYSTLWLDGMLSGRVYLEYMPGWNRSLLGASAWLAILPTAALFLGALVPVVRMVRQSDQSWTYHDRLQVFALGTVGIYVAAIVYMHLTVPIWIWGKASYMTATTPLLAYLAARGYAMLRNAPRIPSAIVFAVFATWFFTAYATYFSL